MSVTYGHWDENTVTSSNLLHCSIVRNGIVTVYNRSIGHNIEHYRTDLCNVHGQITESSSTESGECFRIR